ncbi:mannosyl-oligosaccharide alpha-1,2-mannosidase [Ilyonectria robusta]
MPRRRYRLFTLCAVFIVFLLYRTLQTSWAQSADSYDSLHSPPKSPVQPLAGGGDDSTDLSGHASPPLLADEQDAAEKHLYGDSKAKDTEVKDTEVKDTSEYDGSSDSASGDGSSAPPSKPAAKDEEPVKEAVPEVPKVHWTDPPVNNHNMEHPAEDAEELAQHWVRPKENFPLPSASLIPIPTGIPKQIPKVQYDFDPESDQAKATRLKRQARVKVELERAWSGYRKYAWMHDELSPLSNGYRDPFCGWAATLVDSLDTLWIADMRDEFDEAATAVAKIDFTFTPKNDIPVFETTIRYLGGLLAAYDVSGGAEGKYPILLQKATELAEILMGMFDTPNRMPILYYVWRPPYSSEPHRAGSVGIAELATLSLEFTRLAQLTGAAKYYDAINRITDALVLMQAEGHTHIPGLFPERIDASGCNKTATTLRDTLSKEAQKQIDSHELDVPPKGFQTEPEANSEAKSESKSESKPDMKLNARAVIPPPNPDAEKSQESGSDNSLGPVYAPSSNEEAEGETKNIGRVGPLSADGSTSKWDCVPQGLMPASYGGAQYHMGGAQDSAYEYFPKQYLLLGGLESKYQKLHEDTIDAINDRLLYRPMVDGKEWDILLPTKLSLVGRSETKFTTSYEMAHLTCFIGGMYGLGGKIFGRPKDIETAKQLTDACVWAYQSTATGVMPEFAHLAPCPTLEKCEFNQTYWYELLDGSMEWRKKELAKWEKAAAEADKEQVNKEADALKQQAARNAEAVKNAQLAKEDDAEDSSKKADPINRLDDLSTSSESELKPKEKSKLIKRAGIPMPELDLELSAPKGEAGSELPASLKKKLGMDNTRWADKEVEKEAEKETDLEEEYSAPPPSKVNLGTKPMTHEEYVESKLKREKLPSGYTSIDTPAYILRPEAIESVWYMYRITGDPEWMDKGWKMFEATIAVTRTEFSHSAIYDVMETGGGLKDEMESFWIAETLKYYYLLFSGPDLISLDEWVLNTEAHPFKRPT